MSDGIRELSDGVNSNIVELATQVEDYGLSRRCILNLLIARAVLPVSFRPSTGQTNPSRPCHDQLEIPLGGLARSVVFIDSNSSFSPQDLYNTTMLFVKRRLKVYEGLGYSIPQPEIQDLVRSALQHVCVISPTDPRPQSVFHSLSTLTRDVMDGKMGRLVDWSVWAFIMDGWDEVSWPGWQSLPPESTDQDKEMTDGQEDQDSEMTEPVTSQDVFNLVHFLANQFSCLGIFAAAHPSLFKEDDRLYPNPRPSLNPGINIGIYPSSTEKSLSPHHRARVMPLRSFKAVVYEKRPDSIKEMKAWVKTASSHLGLGKAPRSRLDLEHTFMVERGAAWNVNYDTIMSGFYFRKM